ncbi:hypothetical protein ACTFO4_18260 [Bacillus cereus group sp. MYBKT14-1]|nr:hypothetical protein [Bacillus cereus]MEC1983398.1 hypothetical protein [Bacillus cereus]
MGSEIITFKLLKQYKIDPNKIQSLDDVITTLRNVTINVNDEEVF